MSVQHPTCKSQNAIHTREIASGSEKFNSFRLSTCYSSRHRLSLVSPYADPLFSPQSLNVSRPWRLDNEYMEATHIQQSLQGSDFIIYH